MGKTSIDVKIYSPKDFPSYLPKLSQLYDDLLSQGKGFRAKLIRKISESLRLDTGTEHLLAQTVEFVHNASLLHDDLIDRSPLRRGKVAAWRKYSPEYAVLAGDYLLARVMVNLSNHGNIRLVQYTSEVISDLLEGEWLQDSLVGDFNVDLSQLDRVHNMKTSSLFKWCLRAPFIALNRNEMDLHTSLEEMGTLIGQLFQRGDDLLDFDVRNEEGKAILGDLTSGYLNSFGAFMAPLTDRQKLRPCRTMEEVYQALGGEKVFRQKVEEFDEKNKFLIQLYIHHVNTLDKYLRPEEKDLLEVLRPITDTLYWRKV